MAKKRMYLNGKIVEVDDEQLKSRTYNDLAPIYNQNVSEEIAPVYNQTKKKKNKKEWYETIVEIPESFKDGYHLGDISRTIVGSTTDAGLNAIEGIFRVGEGIAKVGAGLTAEGIDLFNGGESEYTRGIRRRISGAEGDMPMSRLANWLEDKIGGYSILGETGDEIFSGIGYTMGMFEGGKVLPGGGNVELSVGNHVARLPILSAVGGAGSGFQEAYSKGLTGKQAVAKALGSGAIESLTESMFGFMGIGGNDITDKMALNFANRFESGIAQNLAKLGISSTAEGFEEVISSAGNQFLDRFIDQFSGENDPKLYEKLNPDELAQEFVTTFLSTAISGGYNSVTNINYLTNNAIENFEKEAGRPLTVAEKTSVRDQVARALANENTLNEQQVIDNEMNSRLAELGEYNRADRSRIRNEINQDLANGRISVDSIENTLPGISNQWQEQYDELKSLQEEIKNSEGAEKKYLINEYKQKLQEYNRDERLRNSYVEEANKGRRFSYDSTEGMSDMAKATYQSAMESGMDNTKETHNKVELASKIADYTGVNIRFTTNEYLQTIPEIASKMTEGTVVNGANVKSQNTIYINKDSNKTLETVIGHEVGHLLDNMNEGKKIRDFARKYADSIGEYNDRYTRLSKNYNKNEISTEMANDIIGEKLFTDEEFVSKLATEHPNTFQKIYDWFEHIFKMATSGSKEARQLEQVRYNLEKGLAKINENKVADTNVGESGKDINVGTKENVEKSNKIEYNKSTEREDFTDALSKKQWHRFYENVDKHGVEQKQEGAINTIIIDDKIIRSKYDGEKPNVFDVYKISEGFDELSKKFDITTNDILQDIYDIAEEENVDERKIKKCLEKYFKEGLLGRYDSNNNVFVDKNTDTGKNFERSDRGVRKEFRGREDLSRTKQNRSIDDTSFSLSEQLEKNLEKTLFNAEKERQGMIDIFNSYLEENGIENPTQEDINNSLDAYDLMDANEDGTPISAIEKKYDQTIKEYLKEQGISLEEEIVPVDNNMVSRKKDGTLQIRQEDIKATDEDLENIFGKEINEEYHEAMEDAENVKFSISEDGELVDDKGKKVKLEASEVGSSKTLMAIHNLSEEKMEGILELGGFPVPSIAITNPNIVDHDHYGKISVLFDKKTIDPSIKGNEVYDRDVWSPRFPNVDREISDKVVDKVAKDIGISESSLQSLAEEYNTEEGLAYRLATDLDIVEKYLKDNNIKVSETDNERKVAEENGIKEFLNEKIAGIYGKKGIYNGKEYITENGNRRSFWQLHDEYNIENIVKNLKSQDTVSSEKGFGTGGFGNIQANLSNQYNSIEEIKNNENKLMTQEEAQKVVEPLVNELNDEMTELSKLYGDDFDPFWDMDAINYQLQEFSKLKNIDAEGFYNIANEYNETLTKADKKLVNRIVDTMNKIKEIPTDYFEAKPQRAVGFDEVEAVVIPNDIDENFKKQLTDAGLNYYEYDPSVDGDRNKVINQFENIKFSLSEDEEIAPVKLPKSYEPYYNFAKEHGFLSDDERMMVFNGVDKEGKKSIKNKITTPREEYKKTPRITPEKSQMKKTIDLLDYMFVNRNSEIDNLAKDSGNMNIKYLGDMLNGVSGEAQNETIYGQTNNQGERIGKSINELFDWADSKGLTEAFNDYLLHYSNIDRHKNGKGSKVKLETSEKMVKKYEKAHPEFKEHGEEVWRFSENVRDNLLEAGVINQSLHDYLGDVYPHYVPYMEEKDYTEYFDDSGKLKPVSTIKSAKGGATHSALTPVQEALTKYVYNEKSQIRRNDLYREIYNTLDGEKMLLGADDNSNYMNDNFTGLYRDENGNYLTAYFDGELNAIRVSDDLYNQLNKTMEKQVKNVEQSLSLLTSPLQKISNIRRNILTTWSPSFLLKNPIKDFGDALINSTDTKRFMKNYLPAYGELMKDTELAQQFKALYGSGNAMGEYESESGLSTGKKAIRKGKGMLQKIANFNEIVELAPRFAEFKSTLERGGTIQEAMYNAREVTINFNRGGVITKAMNRNGFTFLNASVQGFDKFIRNFSGQNGAIGVVGALMKATMYGVAPALFNHIIFAGGDDPDKDYEVLPDYIKDNYYLIKTDNGKFIRIPKGRIPAVFGMVARRTLEYANGEEDAFEGMGESVYDQVGFDPFNNHILAPIQQAYWSGENGRAWYGGDLVPTRLQDKPAGEQFDESTDTISKWIGSKFGISPYKLNYVLDQYTGGMGDILLPMMTEEASSDAESLPEYAIAPIKDQFLVDTTMDNKYAGEFFDTKDDLNVQSNSMYATDEDILKNKYMNSVSSELSKLYAEKREIQSDTSLSKKQKYEKVKAIQDEINKLAKEGLDGYTQLNKSDNYAIIGDREYYKDGDEWKKVNEKELEMLNSLGLDLNEKTSYINSKSDITDIKEEYEEALNDATEEEKTILNRQKKLDIIQTVKNSNLTDEAKAYLYTKNYGDYATVNSINNLGISMNDYLDLESQNFTSDKYSNGKTVPNSKKKKTMNYINSMNLTKEQKVILAKLKYPSMKEYNPQIIQYIQNNRYLDYDEKKKLLEKLGFKVENNKVSW